MKRFAVVLLMFLIVALPVFAWKNVLEVHVGETARGVALSPDGKTLYVGAIRDKKVVAVDVRDQEVIFDVNLTEFNSGAWAKAVWVNGKGNVFAPGSDVPEIYVFDSDLMWLETYYIDGFGITDCEGAVADDHGNIYASDRSGIGGIYKIRHEDGDLDAKWGQGGWADVGHVRLPYLKGDAIYAVDHTTSILYKIDLATGKVTTLANLAPSGFAVAVDDNGVIYVAHYSNPSVAVSVIENGKVTEYSPSAFGLTSNVGGIAVTKDGSTLYLVEEQSGIGGLVLGFTK